MRLEIVARADVETLPRLIALFSQRSLVPCRVEAERVGDRPEVRIEHRTLDAGTAEQIAARIARSPMVERVMLAQEISPRRR